MSEDRSVMWFDHATGKPIRDEDMSREQLVEALRATMGQVQAMQETRRAIRGQRFEEEESFVIEAIQTINSMGASLLKKGGAYGDKGSSE